MDKGERLPSGGYEHHPRHHDHRIDAADEGFVYWGQDTSSADFAEDIHKLLND